MNVVGYEDLCPKLRLTAFNEIASLLLEHRILVGNSDELIITEPFRICDIRKVRIPGLAELADNKRLVQLGMKLFNPCGLSVCDNSHGYPSRMPPGCCYYQCKSWRERCILQGLESQTVRELLAMGG